MLKLLIVAIVLKIRVKLIIVQEVVKIPSVGVETLLGETAQLAAFALGGPAQTFAAVHKTAYLDHVKQVHFRSRGDVFHVSGHELGSKPVFGEIKNAKGVGDRRFAHLYDIAHFYHARRLCRRVANAHTAFFACVGGYGARFENAYRPQPFVNSDF